MRPSTISAIGSFTALDSTADDYLAIAPSRCSGFGDPPLRTTVEPAPGGDGALIFAPFDDAWIITLAGDIVIRSTGLSVETGYRDAVEAMYGDLVSALADGKTAAIDLAHSGDTLKVWKNSEVDQAWDDLETICSVTFSVVVDVFA